MKIVKVNKVADIVNQCTNRTASVAVGMNASRVLVSPSRLYMLGKNLGKAAVIHHSTPRRYTSGEEIEYAKTARKIEIDSDVRVEGVFFVKDFQNSAEPMLWGTVYVIVKQLETGYYDLIEMTKFNAQNMDLGFEYRYDQELLRNVREDAMFKKGTVFGTSARITDSGEWCPGIETAVATMSHVYTEEDAVVIFEHYAKKIAVTFQRMHDHQWNEDEWVPLNLYGTSQFHQPTPLSGEPVRADGIVMGFRKKDPNAGLAGMSKKALMKPDPVYDVLFYSTPGCIVADIEVQTERYKNQSNNRRAEKATQPHTVVLEKIEESYNSFYNEVLRWFRRKNHQYANNVPVTEALENFITRCLGNVTRDYHTPGANGRFHKVKRKIYNIPLKDWRIIIRLKEDVEGKVRFKNTGMDGNKSVIMKVLPSEMAPVDDHGNMADMIVGNTPAFRRQILSSLLEQDINFVNIHLWPKIKAAKEAGNYQEAWDNAFKFYDTVNPEFAALADSLNADQRIEHIDWITRNEYEFSVKGAQSGNIVGVKISDRLEKTYPNIKPTPVTYKNEFGETIRTRYPIPISSLYYIMLDKFGDDISCQSLPKLNIFGLPTSLSKHERAREFYRAVLNRNVGETEGRLYINQKGGAAAVRALSLANGPKNLEKACKRILRAPNPFLIEQLIKPGEENDNHSIQVIENIMSDFGIRLRKERPSDIV
ncbi:RNA polymerase [Aeromonas phage AerS_266]|nr:RNA polymerase [Aeromonas phage AerS_266]